MNKEIIKEIAITLKVREVQVEKTIEMLSEGNTIPFIARYRKEATGGLDEEQIKEIDSVYQYQVNLFDRKNAVIDLIDEKGMLTDELKEQIMKAQKLVDVEDLYRPFKEKKKTKATEAVKNGLEPLADLIMKFGQINLEKEAESFLNDTVLTVEAAIEGAGHIIAERISDNAHYRKWIRVNTYIAGTLVSKVKKGAVDENKTFEMYYEYSEPVKNVKPHRVLALNRGEKEKVLSVKIDVDEAVMLEYLEQKEIKDFKSSVASYVKEFIKDSYKRLIFPSIEREIRSELSENSEIVAVNNFGSNLERLLLTPPLKEKMILALDPAYRTGCKLAVIDGMGKKLDIKVIYPHAPQNQWEKSMETVLELIKKYKIDIVAIGNGTASRESEVFVADTIKKADHKVEYIIVNEAGASVYSASKIAIEEFPDLVVEERSAVSIGRRLQDPLSELVKIDPKSIGVGLYQHDVSPKLLNERLDFVVSKAVNAVGVNVNTASSSLLKYVSGMNKKTIEKVIALRDKKGRIGSRKEIEKLLGAKTYEQAIGFLRVLNSDNILDATDIHPESYDVAKKILEEFDSTIEMIGSEDIISKLDGINIDEMAKKYNVDNYTLEDIIKSLKKPNRDPRDNMDKPILKSDVLSMDDLKVGMKLQGTVRNVVDFGAFIDIGLKNDGLVHISKITNRYIKHPSEVLAVGDIVDCYVIDIVKEKNKVSLSLID